jgi:hypothetical protein
MSSPKSATAKRAAARPARGRKPAVREVVKRADDGADATTLSADAQRLATEIERVLAAGRSDLLSAEALQALMAALCRTYGAQIEAGLDTRPLKGQGDVTNTDVMIMASALLRSADLAVFELGMWQSWTGR